MEGVCACTPKGPDSGHHPHLHHHTTTTTIPMSAGEAWLLFLLAPAQEKANAAAQDHEQTGQEAEQLEAEEPDEIVELLVSAQDNEQTEAAYPEDWRSDHMMGEEEDTSSPQHPIGWQRDCEHAE